MAGDGSEPAAAKPLAKVGPAMSMGKAMSIAIREPKLWLVYGSTALVTPTFDLTSLLPMYLDSLGMVTTLPAALCVATAFMTKTLPFLAVLGCGPDRNAGFAFPGRGGPGGADRRPAAAEADAVAAAVPVRAAARRVGRRHAGALQPEEGLPDNPARAGRNHDRRRADSLVSSSPNPPAQAAARASHCLAVPELAAATSVCELDAAALRPVWGVHWALT